MKRNYRFLLPALLLAAAAMTGCSSANSSGGGTASGSSEGTSSVEAADNGVTEVEFWHLFGGGDGETMAKMIEEFNNSQSEYKVVGTVQDWNTFYTKLQTSVFAGEGPDLSVSHHQYIWTLANKGVIEPMDAACDKMGVEMNFDQFDPVIEQEKYKDAYYSAPIDLQCMVLFYNKELCKKAGLLDENGDLIDYGTGVDNFIAMLDKAQEAQGGTPALTLPTTGGEPMNFFASFYYQLGGQGQFIADDRLTWNADEKTAVEALEIYKKIYDHSLKNVENCSEVFVNGQTTFLMAGPWNLNTLRSGMGDDAFGVTTLPVVGDGPMFESGGHCFVLPVNDTRTDEETKGALEFVKWFTHNSDIWAESGAFPGYLPCRETELFKSYPYHKYFIEALDHQTPLTFTAPFNMSGGVAEINEPLSKLVNGEVDAEGAYSEMKERMEAACAAAQ